MSGVADWLLHLDPVWIYVAVASLVFLEDAIFVGFAVPGETAAVIAGVAASLDHVDLRLAVFIVVAAAILVDSVGYEVGRSFFGPKVLEGKMFDKHRHRVEKARDLLRRRGGVAVFVGRWTAFFRAMMPALAGASGMRYRKFLAWNAIGGIAWGTTFVLLGHAAGTSYHVIEKQVGHWVAIVVAGLVVLGLVVWHFRRRRAEASEEV
jgi:membrane-associated protein